MNAHGSVRALETWYSSCVYSAATRAICLARFPRVLQQRQKCSVQDKHACTYLSSASAWEVGCMDPTVAESFPSSSGEEMSNRDSRRVIDSETFIRRCRNAFSSRMAALRSSFSLIPSWMTCRVFLASYSTHREIDKGDSFQRTKYTERARRTSTRPFRSANGRFMLSSLVPSPRRSVLRLMNAS